ncbi:uncharacterized protein LOC135215525 isoform X2 [Macrobrachium nipponense]|uniref:uncharacterized protein LOC135215525 isoform X2 n=1 Tax=Macrobrachium nipponense TaxID=159736 RepID=UPI0030C835D6
MERILVITYSCYLLLLMDKKPQVLSGIKEETIPYRKFFKFNNSALYARCKEPEREEQDNGDDEVSTFDTMFWEMGEKSFVRLIEGLNLTQSRSLTLTKEVLEVSVTGLQVDIQTGLHKLDQLRNEVEVLITHQADIDRNRNFTYTVTEETFVTEPIPDGQFITNCLECRRTCHENCAIRNNDQKHGCWAITDENCRICPGQCHWKMHGNIPYKYICKQVEVTKTAEDLRRRYEEATEKKLSAEQLVKEVEEEFEAVQIKVLGMTETVRKSLKRLKEIALKPNPLSTVEYIDILIESEKSQAQPGWQTRAKHLQAVREKAKYMKEVADKGFDPFLEIKKKIEEENKQKKSGYWSQTKNFIKNIFT